MGSLYKQRKLHEKVLILISLKYFGNIDVIDNDQFE